jgi:tocopherol O-methyltransferase
VRLGAALVPIDRAISSADVRSYYSETAFDYGALWYNSANLAMHFGYQSSPSMAHSESLGNSNRVLADLAKVKPGDRVLDAGCGIGGSALWLASQRAACVIGIALGTDQIRCANQETKRRSLSAAARFLVADFTAIPFSANTFDVVWAQESLCHTKDKTEFVQEAARVLKPNGRLIVADGMLKRSHVSDREWTLLRQWYDGWKLAGLWTAAQHANAVKAAGFSVVSIQDVTAKTMASHRRLYQRANGMLPLCKLLSLGGLRNSMQTGNAIAALRQYEALRKDCWFYGILLAHKA